MPAETASLTGPIQALGAALSTPLVSLVLAAIVTGAIVIAAGGNARRRSHIRLGAVSADGVPSRYTGERRTLGISAIGVIAAVVAENLITGYALELNGVVSWWHYAAPVFLASVAVGALLVVIIRRGSAARGVPAVSARRTWLTFSSRTGSTGAALSVLALTATTLLAGLASSNIDGGPYVFLEIGIPNESGIDPVRPWFYGWAYGIPVLVCTALLVAVAVAALHANAARTFLRPESVIAEHHERRVIATGITRLTTAGALLALAGAWRFIAEAGVVTELVEMRADGGSDSYEAVWRYAEIAAIGGWLAPLVEILAFVLLLLVTAQLRPAPTRVPSTSSTGSPVGSGAAR